MEVIRLGFFNRIEIVAKETMILSYILQLSDSDPSWTVTTMRILKVLF